MKRALLALSLTVALTGCTLNDQSAPSLTGPSELALSVSVAASPDTLFQNGTAQSTVSVLVRDSNGNLLPGQQFFVQTRVGSAVNIGTLSASSITTDSQGRAAVVFTAPPADAGNISTISVEFSPVGTTSAANNSTRVVLIKMVKP